MHQLIMSCFGGSPLVILIDLLNGSTGVEEDAIFLTVGDQSGTIYGVSGRDAIVGIGDSFLFIASIYWKVWFSSILVLESICFLFAFCCIQMWFDVKSCSSEFLVGIFHPTPVWVRFGNWL